MMADKAEPELMQLHNRIVRDSGIIGYLKGAVWALQWHNVSVEAKQKIQEILERVEVMEQ